MLDEDALHAACEAKDARFDGQFYTGVTSTGIYCRCVCPARTPRRANRRYYPSAAAAEKAGFRPCLVCRPEKAPGAAPIDQKARLASQALARIEAGALETQGLDDLARDLGVTGRHLRRATADVFGAAPIDLAQTHRLLTAKRLLTETRLPITEVAFASGFQSVRRFNALFLERYGFAPSRLRGKRIEAREPTLTLDLVARGAFDPAAHFAFLRSRALNGVEATGQGAANGYARTLKIGPHAGWIALAGSGRGLTLTLSNDLAPALRPLVAAVRGAFDLDADAAAIDAALGDDAALNVAGEPGVRIPGGLDAFEMAVRAVLGQQVTVGAGRMLAQKLTDAFGAPIVTGVAGLDRLFPDAARLADADPGAIAALGMPRARAETLVRLAEAVAQGRVSLMRGAIAAGRNGLATLAGIGPWTIEYVALRALGDPDAFPAGDSAIRHALGVAPGAVGDVEARAAAWRPWRAYAAVRLWRRHAAMTPTPKTAIRNGEPR
ncbi:MAG: Ada metal-binding domain-containing protein [Hyphomonadaceae bacterium]|nr:Ada metal-binding domain-containing protein [Hyphomonadaceae bacterium]